VESGGKVKENGAGGRELEEGGGGGGRGGRGKMGSLVGSQNQQVKASVVHTVMHMRTH